MKKTFQWLADYFHMFKRGLSMFVYIKPHKHYLGHIVHGKCPIIIIPGILGKWAFMRPIANKLSFDGHPVFVVTKLKNNLFDIPSSARIVREVIEENDIKDAVIVAHSKGGLIGKYLLAHHNEDGRVKGMVSLATPYSGSAMARLVPHDAFLELLPDSLIIKKLKTKRRVNKRIISIIPEYDNHVWSENGSFLEGALENVVVEVSGHHRIISSRKTWEKVQAAIRKLA